MSDEECDYDAARIRAIAFHLGVKYDDDPDNIPKISSEILRVIVRVNTSLAHLTDRPSNQETEDHLDALEKRWNEREINTATLVKGTMLIKNGLDSYCKTLSLPYTEPREIIAAVDSTLRSYINLSHKIDVACAPLEAPIHQEKIDRLIEVANGSAMWKDRCNRHQRRVARQKRREALVGHSLSLCIDEDESD